MNIYWFFAPEPACFVDRWLEAELRHWHVDNRGEYYTTDEFDEWLEAHDSDAWFGYKELPDGEGVAMCVCFSNEEATVEYKLMTGKPWALK